MKKTSRFFYILFFTFVLLAFVINPQKYMDATIDGLIMFVNNVFPSLFPFFIITRILTSLGVGFILTKIVKKPINYLFNTSAIGGYIFILSVISGYPIGAKMIAEFVKNETLTLDEAKKIISFTSTSGPLFILGTVGVKALGDYKAGVIILIAHLSSAILNGFLYRGKGREEIYLQVSEKINKDFFNDAISSSCLSILQVGASIVFLNLLVVLLQETFIIGGLSSLISIFGVNSNIAHGVCIGSIEITKGIIILSDIQKIKDIIVPISTIISFGGLSVMVQSMAFLKPIGLSSTYYILTKISQAIFAYAVSSVLVLLLY